jgi:hypothetical protein
VTARATAPAVTIRYVSALATWKITPVSPEKTSMIAYSGSSNV